MSFPFSLHLGDCRVVLREFQADSLDACITDPPYEIGFMSKAWDNAGVSFQADTWQEIYRVLKPGAHLLAFGGTRTYHRIACAIEDAGFEIRDCIQWLYGQGFPKSLDIGKAIDKAAGAEREVVGPKFYAGHDVRKKDPGGQTMGEGWRRPWQNDREAMLRRTHETAPASDEAKKWDGWGTALKPAYEPIIVARKPLVGTVAQNILKHGVGGLNIDGCRITYLGKSDQIEATRSQRKTSRSGALAGGGREDHERKSFTPTASPIGRWPANILLDEEAAEMLDEQTGILKSGKLDTANNSIAIFGSITRGTGKRSTVLEANSGGASRFFYCAKVSPAERNAGLETMDWVLAGEMTGRQEGSAGLESPRAGAGRSSGGRNFHPTVKPVALMRYLVRLVTPPGGRVVDPFLGSGSTGIAVLMEGAQFIGVELDPEYLTIARRRIVHGIRKPILSENQPVSMQNKIKRYPVLEDQKCS